MSRGSWLAFLTRMSLAEDTPQDRAQWGSDPLSLPTAAVTKSHETRAFRDKVPSHGSGAQTSEIQVWQGGHGCGPRGAARGLPPRHVGMSVAVSSPRLLASLSAHIADRVQIPLSLQGHQSWCVRAPPGDGLCEDPAS